MVSDEEPIVKEAFRQTELKLVELNRIAEAADRRAMAFAGFAGVIATLLFSSANNMPLEWVNYVGGIVVFCGAYLAATSAFPRGFYTPGQRFGHWEHHLVDGDSFIDALKFRAAENDERIIKNEKSLDENADRLKSGVSVSMAAGVLTATIQLFALLLLADHVP